MCSVDSDSRMGLATWDEAGRVTSITVGKEATAQVSHGASGARNSVFMKGHQVQQHPTTSSQS